MFYFFFFLMSELFSPVIIGLNDYSEHALEMLCVILSIDFERSLEVTYSEKLSKPGIEQQHMTVYSLLYSFLCYSLLPK